MLVGHDCRQLRLGQLLKRKGAGKQKKFGEGAVGAVSPKYQRLVCPAALLFFLLLSLYLSLPFRNPLFHRSGSGAA